MIDFVSNVAEDFTTTPHTFPMIGNLVRFIVAAAGKCGNRISQVQMPPNWPKHGVYQLIVEAGTSNVSVKHNFLQLEVHVDAKIFDISDPTKLHITDNFSEDKARLVETGSV